MQTDMQTDMSSGQETDVRHKAEETASTVVSQAQEVASSQVSTQKERAASTLDSVAQSLRKTGSEMRDEQPQLASLAEQAAGRVGDVSNYLREHELRDFVREAENFARREPLLFLGGAFAVGFVAARFLKASSPNRGGGQWSGQGGGENWRYGGNVRGGYGATRGLGEGYGASGYAAGGYAGGGYGASDYASGATGATGSAGAAGMAGAAGAAYDTSGGEYDAGSTGSGVSSVGSELETDDESDTNREREA